MCGWYGGVFLDLSSESSANHFLNYHSGGVTLEKTSTATLEAAGVLLDATEKLTFDDVVMGSGRFITTEFYYNGTIGTSGDIFVLKVGS